MVAGYDNLIEVGESIMVPSLRVRGVQSSSMTSTLTPRSMQAAERAVAEGAAAAQEAHAEAMAAREQQMSARSAQQAAERVVSTLQSKAIGTNSSVSSAAIQAVAEAASKKAAAEEAAALAQRTARKAALASATVCASLGTYVLLSARHWKAVTEERFDSGEDAMAAASQLWRPWVLFLQQRGSFTEVRSGGSRVPFVHVAIRQQVYRLNAKALHATMGNIYGGTIAGH